MTNGFFRVAFTGATGSGLAVLAFHNGSVVGADTGGGLYDGSYTENAETGTLEFTITLTLPAGAVPVQLGTPLPTPISVSIRTSLKEDEIGSSTPKLVQTQMGPVNVLFTKLRNL